MRKILWAVLALSLFAVQPGFAQEFPDKPVTMYVPYPPGGNVDVTARLVQNGMAEKLGQTVVVENRPGGGAQLAGLQVSRSAPDGYSIFIGSTGPVMMSALVLQAPLYRWQEAFTPVSMVAIANTVMVVREGLPSKSLKDVLDYAKAHPGKFTIGTSAAGSINHMASELLQLQSGIHMQGAFYRGDAAVVTDVMAGHIEAGIVQLSSAIGAIKGGKVRAVALFSRERSPNLPDVPTAIESGFPTLLAENFVGVLAPKGTPKPIVDKIAGAIRHALENDEVKKRFEALGSEANPSTPEEFTKFLTVETAKWKEVVTKNNIVVK
jgi:tripartite-type tricarboxylate transporter receptor subunit TctC